jgi:hypothetical protein
MCGNVAMEMDEQTHSRLAQSAVSQSSYDVKREAKTSW